MHQQGLTQANIRAQTDAAAAKLRAEGAISAEDLKAIQSTSGAGRLARELKPISDIGADWLSPGKLIDKFLPNKRGSSSSTTRESGTTYDRKGRETGGYSRERSEIRR